MYAFIGLVVILVEDKVGPQASPKWVPILMGLVWPLHFLVFLGFFIAAMRKGSE